MLHNCTTLIPNLKIGSEVVELVDYFIYLKSCISLNGLISDEISGQMQRAHVTFANMHHLWRKRDIRLPTKGYVYCSAFLSVLFYCSLRHDHWQWETGND